MEECAEITNNKCDYFKIIDLSSTNINTSYGLSKQKVFQIISNVLPTHNPNYVFQDLINKGFLLEFKDSYGNLLYRSVYMDMFIRSSELKTARFTSNYVVKPRLVLVKTTIPTMSDRSYRISQGSNVPEIDQLVQLLTKELGPNKAKHFIDIVDEYLKLKGYTGLDLVQIDMIKTAIELYLNNKHVVIEAPTGFGKTEIFIFLLLFILLKFDFDPNHRVLILYPRKALALDNMNRLITLSVAIENILNKKVPILIRDGDSQPKLTNGLLRGGNLTCPKKHPLKYDGKKVTCSDSSCPYATRDFAIIDSTQYKTSGLSPLIIVSNINTVANRLLTFNKNSQDMNVEDFKTINAIILDEMHVYTGNFGGIVSSILDGIRTLNPNVRFIGVSATIPNRIGFSKSLFNTSKNNVGIVSSINSLKKVSNKIIGEKLYILGFFEIRPDISWQSYAQLWGILASSYSLIHLNRLNPNQLSQPNMNNLLYQNIVFINNIHELIRFRSGFKQNISLGEPCKDRLTDDPNKALNDPFYIYSPNYSTYCSQNLLGKSIENLSDIVFMDKKNKFDVFSKITSGAYISIGSTSSLELGVDYEGVSFILNAGTDDEVEIVQRLGRAGRSEKMPRIVIGIVISKNVPVQSFRIHDKRYIYRIIYMLAGNKLSKKKRKDIRLKVTKTTKPIVEFNLLLNGAISYYNNQVGNFDVCDYINYVINLNSKTSLHKSSASVHSQVLNELNLYSNLCAKSSSVTSCDSIIKEYEKEKSYENKIKEFPIKFRRWYEQFLELRKKYSDVFTPNVESSLVTIDQKSKLVLDYFKTNVINELDNLNNLSKVGNEIQKEILNIQSELLNIQKYIEEVFNTKSSKKIKEVKDKISQLKQELVEKFEKVDKTVRNYIKTVNKVNSITSFRNICSKVLSTKRSFGGNTSIKDFIFDYSSVSNSGLNIVDNNLNVIRLEIDEFNNNSWSPVYISDNYMSLEQLFSRFPPFIPLDYSHYVSGGSQIPKYAVLLLGLDPSKNYWNGTKKIGQFIGIPIRSGHKVIDVTSLNDNVKMYNLLQMEDILKSPIVILGKEREFYVKLGVDKSYLQDYLQMNTSKLFNKATQLRIKYNPLILNYTKTCDYGLSITNDVFDITCPFSYSCTIFRNIIAQNRQQCPLWNGYSMKLAKRPLLLFKIKTLSPTRSSIAITSPLFKISENPSFPLYKTLYGVTIFVNDTPQIIYLNPKVREKLHDTNAIEITFNRILVRKILENILFNSQKNNKLLQILLTKYYLLKTGRKSVYRAIKRLTNKSNSYSNFEKDVLGKNREKFLDFAYAVLLHTLAHLIYEFISLELDIEEDLIDYYYEFNISDPSYSSDSIYIYEKTSFGVLKFSSILKSNFGNFQNFIDSFMNFVTKSLNQHTIEIKQYGSKLKSLKQSLIGSNQYLKEDVNILKGMLRSHIRPDLYIFKLSISFKLSNSLRLKPNQAPKASKYLDYADIALGRFCVDGCSSCVMIDECHYPLYQNLITSRRLAKLFLKEIANKGKIKNAIQVYGTSKLGFDLLRYYLTDRDARKAIIKSAYIDESCLKVIEDALSSNPSLSVELIIDDNNNRQKLDDSTIKTLIGKLTSTNRFKLNLQNNIHYKEYTIEFDNRLYTNGNKITISGSWNCQKSDKAQNFTISI
jgi:DEAD/DEAH box helicase domain-containing protein